MRFQKKKNYSVISQRNNHQFSSSTNPNNISTFKTACALIILLVSFTGILSSILMINDSSKNLRESTVKKYYDDELLWGNTYLKEMESININIIKDEDLYKK